MKHTKFGLLITMLTAAPFASAELFVHPIPQSSGGLSAYIGTSDIDYDDNASVDRTFVSGAYTMPLSTTAHVFGFGGLLTNSEGSQEIFGYNISTTGGTGYVVGGGALRRLNLQTGGSINIYGQFSYFNEDYGRIPDAEEDGVKVSATGSGYELAIGGVASMAPSPDLNVWGGIEFIPLTDWETTITASNSVASEEKTDDSKREDKLVIRLGADYGPFTASFSLLGETTFMIGYRMRWGERAPYRKTASSPSPRPIKSHQPSPAVAQPAPPAVSPSPTTFNATPVQSAQRALTAFGYDPGPADGVMGGKTRRALRLFQQDKGLPVTGRLDKATRDVLGI